MDGLRHVATLAGLRGFVKDSHVKREWMLFILDVGALCVAQKCQENAYVCECCNLTFWGAQEVIDHFNEEHDFVLEDPTEQREFKNVILEPGLGHVEENFNSNWCSDKVNYTNFVEALIMSTGFSKQQAYFQANSKNNHVIGGWRRVVIEAVLCEAIATYLKLCHDHEKGEW